MAYTFDQSQILLINDKYFRWLANITLLFMGREEWPYRSLRKREGRNRNALPLRSERSSTKLENTSLSTDVPLGFLYAAFPLPPLYNRNHYISLDKGLFPAPYL